MNSNSKTRQEVADEYGVSVRTLFRWLKKHKIEVPERDRITPSVQQKIYEKLGCPIMSENDLKRPKMPDYGTNKWR